MCEANLPPELEHDLQQSEESDQPEIGANWALAQVKELLQWGLPWLSPICP